METVTVCILFIYVSPAPTESLAHKGCSKTLVIDIIITVMATIISAHPLGSAQGEAERT